MYAKKYRLNRIPDEKGLVWREYDRSMFGHVFIANVNNEVDVGTYLDKSYGEIKDLLGEHLLLWKGCKFNVLFECTYECNGREDVSANIKTKTMTIDLGSNLSSVLDEANEEIIREMTEGGPKGSGWALKRIDGLLCRFYKFNILERSSYIPLPEAIAKKNAVINVKNRDVYSFKYSILASILVRRGSRQGNERVSSYRHLPHNFDFDCVSFPTPLSEIETFEKVNNVSVNVYAIDYKRHDKPEIYPLRLCSEERGGSHFDLLLLSNGDSSHYCYISNFARLVRSQVTGDNRAYDFCKRCLIAFPLRSSKKSIHMEFCKAHNFVRAVMPSFDKSNTFVYFDSHERKVPVPIVVYCDFESSTKNIANIEDNCDDEREHNVISFGIFVVSRTDAFPSSSSPIVYTGDDALDKFCQKIVEIGKEVESLYASNVPKLPLTDEELSLFLEADRCQICDQPFIGPGKKVVGHDHLTGRFRFVAHDSCNSRLQLPHFLPIYFHNLSGYDGHFIVRKLGYDNKTVNIIASPEEKFTYIEKKIGPKMWFRFMDTYTFLSESIKELALNSEHFPYIDSVFPDPQERYLAKRKPAFPYSFMDSASKLKMTSLPPIEALQEEEMSSEEYRFAQEVWDCFNITSLKEYIELYLKIDVLLLVDIFENFRNLSLKTYQLDPSYYKTLPSLSCHCMLKYTGVKLELLTDYDMHLFVESALRRGPVQPVTRYSKANNKYLEDYDPSRPSSYIFYTNCNSLHGSCMGHHLPVDGFEWVGDVGSIDLEEYTLSSDKGLILECDLEVPPWLHDELDQYPLLPMNGLPPINGLPPPNGKVKRLLGTLENKTRHILHHSNLKQALRKGILLKKIHRAVEFNQSPWLKPYVDLNIEFRNRAKNDFEKNFFELFINCIYGKMIENIRNYKNIKISRSSEAIEKSIQKPNFIDLDIVEDVFLVNMAETKIFFNKPITVGFAISELSKYHMYDFYYDELKARYGGDRMSLLYTDTDSFILDIRTDDLYHDLYRMGHLFDTSGYPPGHKCFSLDNKNKLGCFKDVANGLIVREFVGLGS